MLVSTIASTPPTNIYPGFTELVLTTTQVGLPDYGVLVVITLILLLSAKEVLSASAKWSKELDCSLNMSIVPLIIVFVAIILFKLSKII
ncbi:MAG: hypothetical protein SCH66_14730 [Methanolobus sp.]|nr:hypothetical protein [Methanolobus sp.]